MVCLFMLALIVWRVGCESKVQWRVWPLHRLLELFMLRWWSRLCWSLSLRLLKPRCGHRSLRMSTSSCRLCMSTFWKDMLWI